MNRKIVIAGAGVMGASLAQVYAKADYQVTLYDVVAAGLEKGKHLVNLNQETLVAEEIITAEESEKIFSLISYTMDKECFKDCNLVLECIVERMDVKHTSGKRFLSWHGLMRCWPRIPAACISPRLPRWSRTRSDLSASTGSIRPTCCRYAS